MDFEGYEDYEESAAALGLDLELGEDGGPFLTLAQAGALPTSRASSGHSQPAGGYPGSPRIGSASGPARRPLELDPLLQEDFARVRQQTASGSSAGRRHGLSSRGSTASSAGGDAASSASGGWTRGGA